MEQRQLKELKKKIFLTFPLGIMAIALLLFIPAGTLDYWPAWVFLGTMGFPVIFVVAYFLKHDPEFLVRRMRFREKMAREKIIVKLGGLAYFAAFICPGLDRRFGWSDVPLWLVILAEAMVLLGYILVIVVFKFNRYASRIVDVEKGQKLITNGPYAYVRHPMYVGTIMMFFFIPLALASYVSMIFFIPIIVVFIVRIFDEEKILLEKLEGYKEYVQKVKYRLIPGIW